LTREYASIAKITRPKVTGIFPRRRLFGLLDAGRKYPVIWVSGPAGSGKTTLVSSYLDAKKLPCLWYQVDEGDSDIATFFSYMGLAAKKAAPRRRTPLPLLTPEYLQGISTFTLRYFENLFNRFKAPYLLVFDNYHSVPADSNFHDMISNGLSTIPDGINVVLISRHDLPPSLSRLHANELIRMLEWDELRLTLEETVGIIRLRAPGIRSKESKEHLHKTSDGWAAGLILMLESAKRGLEAQWPKKISSKETLDYFGGEVFSKTDQEIKDFLTKTAFLPRMTAKMAEELTGFSKASNILSGLSRNNYFTEMRYHTEPVYQYHPLFREFLMARAKEMFSHDILSTLLHRAALLLEEAGQIEDAISLFHDLGDWDAMVRLIMKQAPLMLEQGRYRPLEEWLDSLPKEMLENDPWLLYWKGAARFPFDPSLAQPYLKQAFEQFRVQGNLQGMLLAWAGIVDSIVWTMEDYSLLDQWIQIFPELPDNPEESISPEVWIRAVSSMIIALAYRPREHSETQEWVRRAVSIVQRPGSSLGKVVILFYLHLHHLFTGDFEQFSITVRSLQQLAQSKETVPLGLIMTRMAEVTYYHMTGDHAKCLKAVSDGVKTSEDTGILFLINILIGNAILCYQNMGDLEMAQRMLEKMVSSLDRLPPYEKGFYQFCQTRQFLLRSELAAASVQAGLALRTATDTGAYYNISMVLLLTAQVMHRIGKHREAWTHLREAFSLAERLGSKLLECSGLMIEAYFHFEEVDEISGLVSLRKALAIGKNRGLPSIFFDQPAVITRLCVKALEEDIEVPYVQDIIRKGRLIPEKPPLHLENWPWPLKIYTLAKFELLRDDKPLKFSGKVQKRPLLMLKAMIAQGKKDVKEEQLCDMLWPEADGDQAYSAFRTTLSRLRQLIGNEKAIGYHEGKASINPLYCWVDAWAFERIFEQIEVESKRIGEDETRGPGEHEKTIRLIEKAISIYQGHFLADETEEFWTTPYREGLRARYLRLITRLGNHLQKIGQWESAIQNYQKALEVDQLAEEFYQHLMICYRHLGQNAKAIEAYKRCKKMLSSVLGIEPSPKTEAIYRTLVGNVKVQRPNAK
jgi:LuxR family maltose regulon positive regulatory protein